MGVRGMKHPPHHQSLPIPRILNTYLAGKRSRCPLESSGQHHKDHLPSAPRRKVNRVTILSTFHLDEQPTTPPSTPGFVSLSQPTSIQNFTLHTPDTPPKNPDTNRITPTINQIVARTIESVYGTPGGTIHYPPPLSTSK